MSIEFGIRAVDSEGNGVESARLFVSYPFTHQEDFTDENGWVHFDRPDTMHGGVRADIFVDGERVREQVWLEDGDTF